MVNLDEFAISPVLTDEGNLTPRGSVDRLAARGLEIETCVKRGGAVKRVAAVTEA
jgi:hypothetical protein